ncbi:hypothetical protein [Comamonas odontotermitis]|uniref:hypothetical protein n=1 Tax=Comamonas odontotermitis TaxID=379895 RepID=UPI001CC7FEC9|nr:hypothetical protein [Comamonas odontotermitis]UBB16131.1 hypothetical protein LAD35_15045 [Comamonas odontotermitis]
MYVLVPKTITDSMMLAGTIPAVDTEAGEVAWTSGQTVAIGNERVYGGRIFRCAKVPDDLSKPPPADELSWSDIRPCNRYAPFDSYVQTAQVGRKGVLTYVLKVPFIDGISLHGLQGNRLQIKVTDGVGGPDLIPPIDRRLKLPRLGWWQYFFRERSPVKSYRLEGLPYKSSMVITITITADEDQAVAVGWLSVGNWTAFGVRSSGSRSGTLFGVSAEIQNYSFRKEFEDGTFRLVPRGSAVNLTLPVVVDSDESNRLFALVEKLKDTPVSVYASSKTKYRFIATVGWLSIGWQPVTSRTTSLNVNVKGVV